MNDMKIFVVNMCNLLMFAIYKVVQIWPGQTVTCKNIRSTHKQNIFLFYVTLTKRFTAGK